MNAGTRVPQPSLELRGIAIGQGRLDITGVLASVGCAIVRTFGGKPS
jgi:hypothetical protein